MRARLVLVVLLAACGGKPTPTTPPAKPAPRVCDRVADHLVGLMSAAQKADPVALDPFRNAIARRCAADAWADGAKACLLAAQKLDDGNSCEAQLTPEQAAALQADLQAAFENLQTK